MQDNLFKGLSKYIRDEITSQNKHQKEKINKMYEILKNLNDGAIVEVDAEELARKQEEERKQKEIAEALEKLKELGYKGDVK